MSPEVQVAGTVRLPLPRAAARRAAEVVLRGEGARRATVSVAFVGERRMRTLNRAYFGKDRPTDVIAFSYHGPSDRRTVDRVRRPSVSRLVGPSVIGDVYICPEVAAKNARRFAVSERQELLRLIVHGVLHVLGYDHPEGVARVNTPMWRRQERYLRRLAGRARS